MNRRQFLAHIRRLAPGTDFFAQFAAELLGMSVQIFHIMILSQKLECRLFAHSDDSRDIIGAVAH